ncbi:hypothetical protein PAF17_18620 [Paracoccus sp. Z330]|uniref:Uncharacterized protein n=1 Tax=Paracoccus onchidii TaxID=3017813 RepID=A0ABT4ZJI2_9RHOB|nr:hypothetical protein [Paracoccus onchidii]MDB6179496.1 hypothetical protein [Paracoccus onchidii]
MLNTVSGHMAALSWLTLSVVTVVGAFSRDTGQLSINLVMTTVFAMIAVFLVWRTNATRRLGSTYPGCRIVDSLLRIETIASLAMLLLGGVLTFAAGLRVWLEGVAVFG